MRAWVLRLNSVWLTKLRNYNHKSQSIVFLDSLPQQVGRDRLKSAARGIDCVGIHESVVGDSPSRKFGPDNDAAGKIFEALSTGRVSYRSVCGNLISARRLSPARVRGHWSHCYPRRR